MFRLVIHGGAGTITRDRMTPALETSYRDALAAALAAGRSLLAAGGSAVDAVEAAVVAMEDSPLFNAGRGANFTWDGGHELDAALMDGATGRAGAVAAVRHVANPVRLARAVMERSDHVLLCGSGADAFAQLAGFAPVDESYFSTDRRRRALERLRAKHGDAPELSEDIRHPESEGGGLGTVGAVALDRRGRLAAATSTGGLTGKRWGRIGDSPIPGAGTWADSTCAVSCTGVGEHFIRLAAAHEVSALMRHAGLGLAAAADSVVLERLPAVGGRGGLVAVSADGDVALPFTTEGMYRGATDDVGGEEISIYR